MTACDTLERPLLKVDGAVVTLQFTAHGKRTGTPHIRAGVLLLRSGLLGASLDSLDGGLWLLLLALGQVEIQEVLRGKGNTTSRTKDRLSLVVLRPGVSGKGAWVDAKFGCILWAIVDKHLNMRQNVLGSLTKRICRK